MSSTTSTLPDEERDYRLIIDRARGLRRGDPVPPRSVSPLRCRPSELQRRLDEWAAVVAKTLQPAMKTYWLVCHAYPVHPRPRTDHGLPAESILAIQPAAPSCLRAMAHDWRFVDPSTHECSRCGLRHSYHTQTASGAPRPWEQYGWSGGSEVGEEDVDEEERIS